MVTTVTRIFLDKVFTKEENTYRIFTLDEGIFLCVCYDAVAIKPNLQLLIYFR